jgi:hypothetical protein
MVAAEATAQESMFAPPAGFFLFFSYLLCISCIYVHTIF